MVNFPSQNTIKKKKSGSLGKRESSRERRRSTQNIVHRTPSGTRILPNPEEELLKQVDDNKPPTSQPREGRTGNTSSASTTSPKSSKAGTGKRKSLAAKPPQSPSSKKLMQRRRSMGKATNTKIVGKNQSVSPKSKKNKNQSKLELKPEVQLASFTTTEESVIASSTIPSEVSEVQLLPVTKAEEEPPMQASTATIDEDMLSIMITGLGEKYRKYIPNFREHKVTVDQLMYAQFDNADYQQIGIDEQDIPVFMSHFNAGHELSSTLEKTVDEYQTAADITPTQIEVDEPVQVTPEEPKIPDETVDNLENKPDQICKVDDAMEIIQKVEEAVEVIIETKDEIIEKVETLEIEQITPENTDQPTPESVEEEAAKLIAADLEKQQASPQPEGRQSDEHMTDENLRDVLINSADKLHEVEARLAHAEQVINEQPEEVLLQKNDENLANDKVPIEGLKDELTEIAAVVEETKLLGEELAEKIETTAAAAVSDESGVDQGDSANTSELRSEENSKESHNTSTSSTSSITDVKKYALIFGTAGILSVGMYKFLRR